MKIITLLLSILFFAGSALAQGVPQCSMNTEPSRAEVVPYSRLADAVAGDVTSSPYVQTLSERETSPDGFSVKATFAVPTSWLNRRVIIRVERASSAFTVTVNDKEAGRAASGAMAVELDVTRLVHQGGNTLTVALHPDAVENAVSTMSAKPMIGEVMVISQPALRIRDVVLSTTINDGGEAVAEFGVVVKCGTLNPKSAKVEYALHLNDSVLLTKGVREITLDMRREDTLRFVARVPQTALWSAESPHRLRLDMCNRIDGRVAECVSREVGVRHIENTPLGMRINNRPVALHLADYDGMRPLDDVLVGNMNGVFVTADVATEALLAECDRRGVYVFVCSPFDTSALPATIRRGGNPTNNPDWRTLALSLGEGAYHATKSHPSVVGYAIARGSTNGIVIYELYLRMKSLETSLPIVYEGYGGEWCSDRISFR
ncbi:MAG: hypothetical protein IIV91_02230 [Alistipes sp.]|nr:hypothetical protein [Alistipes sp.]